MKTNQSKTGLSLNYPKEFDLLEYFDGCICVIPGDGYGIEKRIWNQYKE